MTLSVPKNCSSCQDLKIEIINLNKQIYFVKNQIAKLISDKNHFNSSETTECENSLVFSRNIQSSKISNENIASTSFVQPSPEFPNKLPNKNNVNPEASNFDEIQLVSENGSEADMSWSYESNKQNGGMKKRTLKGRKKS